MRANILLAGLFLSFSSDALHAEYDASSLKNLFTDKSQRSQIDAARTGKNLKAEFQQTNKVNVNGYVTRSDGKSVVWLNNKSTLDSSKIGDVRVHARDIGRDKKVTISVDGKSVRLKPGETWSKETGEILDVK